MINTPDNENISEKQELDVESCAQIIESILFAAGYPITFKKLAEVLETSTLTVRKAVSVLQNSLELDNRGIRLIIVSDSCQLCS